MTSESEVAGKEYVRRFRTERLAELLHCQLAGLSTPHQRWPGTAGKTLVKLHCEGARPDIIFFDRDKTSSGFSEAQRLFPDVVICGDDWSWGEKAYQYPIRAVARQAARRTGKHIAVKRATWLLQSEPLSMRQRLDAILVFVADIVRPVRDRLRGVR